MDIFLATLAFLCSIIGLIGCIVPVLPGIVLNYAALLLLTLTDYADISLSTLLIWGVVTVIVTVADFYLPAWMTRRFGGTRAGAVGATVGVFAGLFLFPPFGILLGPFFGAVLGELTRDKKNSNQAFRSGFGSFLAFIVGTGLKLIVGVWMFALVIGYCYPPVKAWVVGLFA